jgi:large repetitive protein
MKIVSVNGTRAEMSSSNTNNAKPRGSWIKILLLAFGLLLLSAVPARGQSVGGCVANFGGVIDGFVNPVPPSQINIDGNCTIRNFPASNPLTSNISFTGTGRGWLVIFDNVDFTGNLSCDKVHGNFIWFVNGSIAGGHVLSCANLFVPVDKIDKENPPGPPFVSIGVPFTYTLIFPQLVSATTGAVVNPNGSNVEVDQVTVTDNLNATGVSLSYVNSSAAWKGSGAPVPFAVTNASGLLTFSGFPPIPAGQQIVVSVTVVLNNAVPPNSPGTQFSNTANWTLGTTIGGAFHYPIPGQQGVSSPPLTIAAPSLVMTKGGPATMNPGQLGQFTLNVQNTGNSDAWNATIVDKLPTGTTGGMCTATPQILSAQVFQADGVTVVAGKGPLKAGTDYTLSYAGAPACTLTLNMLSAAAVIGPTQRLIVRYQTQLDANTQNGATLTNVAGTTLWYNGPSSDTGRQSYTCTLTNGTPGVLDCQDAHTVTAVIPAVTITKQVTVVGGGRALPGATLDYLVHVTNTSANPVNPVVITDNLNAAGAGALTYVAGTATMNGSPNGVSVAGNVITANYSATYGPLAPGGTIDLRFRATLGSTLAAGTIVTNTGVVTWNIPPQTASASVSITIGGVVGAPNLVFTKSGPATMSMGQWAQFGFNVQNTGTSDAWNVTLLDELPSGSTGGMCSTTPQVFSAQVFQADGVTPVAGKGALVPGTDFSISYVGAPTCKLTLTMLTAAATISPNQRLIITYRTQLDANSQNGAQLTNIAGAVQWFDADSSVSTRQAFTRTLTDGTPGILDFQDAHTVTVVIITIAITKQVSVVGGGAALPGGQLDYLVHVTNGSTNPAPSVVITDDLSTAGAGRLTFVNPPATMNGSTAGISIAGSLLTANYSSVYGPLQPGQSIDVRFRVQIASGLPAGTTLTNTAVVTWNNPPQTASASVSIDIGGVPGSGSLNGTAWLDANFNKIADPGEPLLQGWTVGLYLNGALVQSVLTDVNGVYRFSGVPPTDGTANRYELRFTTPGAGPNTAKLGKADSAFTNWLQRITNIAVPSGSNLQNLNLPIGPNGVVYNSMTRAPIAGATLKMLRGTTPLPATCFDDPAQQGQITQAGGFYRFDLNFSDPGCPSGNSYLIVVTPPGSNYVVGESQVIPPSSNAATTPFSVLTCPTDALPAIPYCEAQASEFAPPPSVAARSAGTVYYLNLTLDGTAVPSSSQIYNNHIPLDPQLVGAFSITKTTPLLNVTRGQLVPYTITINNVVGASLQGEEVVDRYPAGFRYVRGSARLDGQPAEPTVTGLQLAWNGLSFGSSTRTIVLLLAVGAGVGEGEFVNRAQVVDGLTGKPLSGEATARVRVIPDQTFDCTDVFGKVFNDVNRNGVQDDGEDGLPGVRVVAARGLEATTDQYGRFHITCAITPNEDRGSNFVLKLDDRTLPSGFRMSTDQVQIKRATRGKALKFDFGASIHRVVAIDLSDPAFEPGKTEIRVQWRPRVNLLLEELRKAPSVLRLSYVADTEDEALVERRLEAFKRQLTEAWDAKKDGYVLSIEPEVFWRRGGPPKRLDGRMPGSR